MGCPCRAARVAKSLSARNARSAGPSCTCLPMLTSSLHQTRSLEPVSPSKGGEEPPLEGRSAYDAQLLDLKSDPLGRTDRPCPSPPRSATSPSSVTAGRERRRSSRRSFFQTGKINRLGSVRAGTTISDAADDEHERQLSISMSLEHTKWQDRKVTLSTSPAIQRSKVSTAVPRGSSKKPSSQLSAVMGVETIGHERHVAAPPGRQGYISAVIRCPPHTAQMTWISPRRRRG